MQCRDSCSAIIYQALARFLADAESSTTFSLKATKRRFLDYFVGISELILKLIPHEYISTKPHVTSSIPDFLLSQSQSSQAWITVKHKN